MRDKRNAKKELLEYLDLKQMLCAKIVFAPSYYYDNSDYRADEKNEIILKRNYSEEELNEFLKKLEKINYEASYGTQYLFGTVWLTNNIWLERGEYDGSEWWEIKKYPEIPNEL